MKTKKLNTAPINSMMNVVSNTLFIKRTTPLLESRLEASRIKRRPFRSSFLPIAKMMPAPMDVTPSPPICISRARKNCPIGVKVSPASTAISPVTQTALVEVYRESIYFNSTPSRTLHGRIKSTDPIKITAANPNEIRRAGDCA